MNDDTVERLREHVHNDWSASPILCYEAIALIEQQARTIAELREYGDRMEAAYFTAHDQAMQNGIRANEQAARLAECERDAGRYRFLKSMTRAEHSMDQYDGHMYHMGVYDRTMIGLDAAIDAAIDGAKT